MTMLTDELRGWIGKQVTYPAREALSHASIRYFARAMGDANPLYSDDEFSKQAGYRMAVAPPTLVCETCQYSDGPANDTGYIGHEWDLPIRNVRMIRAGNEYEFTRPVYPDDWISVTWTLENMVERKARRGGTQIFITSLATYENQDGDHLASNRETIVLQPLGPEGAP